MPALPTTSLTFHIDASVTTHIWKLYQSTTPFHSGVPVDGDGVQIAEDFDGKDWAANGGSAIWRSTTPLMQNPCLDFNGSSDNYYLYDLSGVNAKTLINLISASAYVVVCSIYVEGVTSNNATIYNNEPIINTTNDRWGIFLKNSSGVYTLNFLNWDGNADVLSPTINLNTKYVAVYWHTGGSIFYELYDSTGLVASGNVASGNIDNTGGNVNLGRQPAVNVYYNGRLGEAAFYNAYNATDKANATQYFRDKWLPAGNIYNDSAALSAATGFNEVPGSIIDTNSALSVIAGFNEVLERIVNDGSTLSAIAGFNEISEGILNADSVLAAATGFDETPGGDFSITYVITAIANYVTTELTETTGSNNRISTWQLLSFYSNVLQWYVSNANLLDEFVNLQTSSPNFVANSLLDALESLTFSANATIAMNAENLISDLINLSATASFLVTGGGADFSSSINLSSNSNFLAALQSLIDAFINLASNSNFSAVISQIDFGDSVLLNTTSTIFAATTYIPGGALAAQITQVLTELAGGSPNANITQIIAELAGGSPDANVSQVVTEVAQRHYTDILSCIIVVQ